MKRIIIYISLFIGILNTNVFADITSGLVAHYEFEGDINDSKNSTNLTQTDILFTNGKIGKSGLFNSTSSYAVSNSSTDLDVNATQSITISAWIKTNASTDNKAIVTNGHGFNESTRDGYSLGMYANTGQVTFGVTGNNVNGLSSTTTVNDDNWHHIVAVLDRSNGMRLYIDGNMESNNTVTESGLALVSSYPFSIGRWDDGSSVMDYWDGELDDIRIYNRVLNATDVTELYNYKLPKLTLKNHGGVIQFDNNTSNIKIDQNLSTITEHTIEFWINSTDNNTTDINNTIIGIYDTIPWSNIKIFDGKLRSQVGKTSGSSNNLSSNAYINDGQWHHVAVTYKSISASEDDVSIYIDGELDVSHNTYGSISEITFNNPSLVIGKNIVDNTANMQLDEVRIWNIARTQADINSTMNHQLDGNETGLVAYYNFDERIGNTVYDITDNNNTATIEGNVTRLNFLGDNLEFDGTGDSISVATELNTTNYTKALWFKAPSSPTGNFISTQGSGHYFWFASGNKIGAAHGGTVYSGTTGLLSENDYNDNQWHYATLTYDSNNTTLKLYIDGELEVQNNGVSEIPTDSSIEIGSFGAGNGPFNGNIAEVSIWNKTLSHEEIKHNMHSAPNISDNQLAGYWPLNEGAGTTAYDRSTNNNNGAITGATWVDTAPKIYGNKIYTSQNIATIHKLAVENNTTLPTYSYNGSVPAEIRDFNGTTGTFAYINPNESNTTLDINANDGGNNINTQFQVITYPNDMNIANNFNLNLSNLNLSDRNITNIQIIGQDGNSENFHVPDLNTSLINGDNNYTLHASNYDQNFSIEFSIIEFDSYNITTTWYYNFSDQKLYPDMENNASFKFSPSTMNTVNIDTNKSNFTYYELLTQFSNNDGNATKITYWHNYSGLGFGITHNINPSTDSNGTFKYTQEGNYTIVVKTQDNLERTYNQTTGDFNISVADIDKFIDLNKSGKVINIDLSTSHFEFINTTFVGTSGDDNQTGTNGNDNFNGLDGNDAFTGGLGDDAIDGGNGTDVAIFSEVQSNYIVIDNGDGTYQITGPDGIDNLSSIEYVQFSNGVNVDINTLVSSTLHNNANISKGYFEITEPITLTQYDNNNSNISNDTFDLYWINSHPNGDGTTHNLEASKVVIIQNSNTHSGETTEAEKRIENNISKTDTYSDLNYTISYGTGNSETNDIVKLYKKSTNTPHMEFKLIEEYNSTVLTSLYTKYNMDVNFSSKAKGYKIIDKMLQEELEVHGSVYNYQTNTEYTSINDYITKHNSSNNFAIINNDINYTKGLIFDGNTTGGILYEINLETNQTINTNAGTWQRITTEKSYQYNGDNTATTNDMIVLKPTIQGYKYNKAIVLASHDSNKLYDANYKDINDTSSSIQLNSYGANDIYKTILDKNLTIPFENNSSYIFNNTEIFDNRLFEIRKDKVEYLDNNVTLEDINATDKKFVLEAYKKGDDDSLAGIRTESKYTFKNIFKPTIILKEGSTSYNRVDTWAIFEDVDVDTTKTADINLTTNKAHIYAGVQVRHNSAKYWITIYDTNWNQKWAISDITDYNNDVYIGSTDEMLNRKLKPVVYIKNNIIHFKIRDENDELFPGGQVTYMHEGLTLHSIDRAEIRAKVNNSSANDKTIVEVHNINLSKWEFPIDVTLNMPNLDLSEHNISSIEYISTDKNATINNSESLIDGLNSVLTTAIPKNTEFSLKFNTDNNTSVWWYNFIDKKLYQNTYGSSQFKTTISDSNSQFDISTSSQNWIYANKPNQIHPIELSISSSTYSNASPDGLNDTSLFILNKHDNDLSIEQILPLESTLYQDRINIKQNGIITKSEKSQLSIEQNASLVVFIKDQTNSIEKEIKYITSLDDTELTSLYSSHDTNITFNTGDRGYKIYKKQVKESCEIFDIHDESYITKSAFLQKYTSGQGGIALAHNRYNNTQALMFQDSTNLMEYNTSSASNILNTGTYSTITNSINCKNKEDDTTIVLNDIIKLNPTTDGYNNLSFGFKDGKVYSLEYILADTTTEIYLLNDKAAKTVTASMSYSTTPIIQESITNEWTYISLPSSSILCKDKNLSISCDQNNTLASVFTDQFTVYKYDQGWSFWDENSSVDQNANKFTSIDPREGVLIKNKSTISKTLNIPYNIFEKLYTKSFVPYTTGWFLINGRFNKTASQIESSVEVNDKKLQYILQFKEATWSVYAPDNDSTISHSLPRISNIDQASSFWIYMNE